MSSEFDFGDDSRTDEERQGEVRQMIRETFSPWKKSEQYLDHPDAPEPSKHKSKPRHNDGAHIFRAFGLEPLPKYLARAEKLQHAAAKNPKALAHFLTHIEKWEKWELGEDGPVFEDIPDKRRDLFEWYLGYDLDDPDERRAAAKRRQKRLRPGGTGLILHGEQGTTKTTAMHWLVANIMEVNQSENVLWQSTLDDTEWLVFAPWATVCLPAGVDVRVTANPHSREYRDLGAFEIQPEDICRQVIRYDDPVHLLDLISERIPGQFYVVYPDPSFRQCQALTGWEYESIWQVDSSDDATDLGHFWFALMEAIRRSPIYNEWTTLVGDEAHKWLRQGKGNDEHDWWNKIDDWATYWGDARKKRLSCILAVHKWVELHDKVRNKVRWGATMNGETFPPDAPISGDNVGDQDLGDTCIWNNLEWNHVGYPDIKRQFSVPADISVTYPGFEREIEAKS